MISLCADALPILCTAGSALARSSLLSHLQMGPIISLVMLLQQRHRLLSFMIALKCDSAS